MQLTIGVIGAAKGLTGEVTVDVRTDEPERRLAIGTMVETDPASVGPVTISTVRTYKGRTYVRFAEYTDRTQVESIRGTRLVIESDEDVLDDDAFFRHELIGLEALDPEGYELGIVADVEYLPAHDILVIREQDGVLTRVPFVKDIVTEVDISDHCVVIDAPDGLFSDADLVIDDAEDAD